MLMGLADVKQTCQQQNTIFDGLKDVKRNWQQQIRTCGCLVDVFWLKKNEANNST